MPQVSMSQQTFGNLEEQLGQHPDEFKSFIKTGVNTGIIVTKDVTIDFLYNALTQFLQFNIGSKHSLAARIAGDNVISNHVIALIHSLPPVDVKAPIAVEDEIEPTASTPIEDSINPTPAEATNIPPAIVVKTPTPATSEVPNGGTSSEQVS